MDLTKLKKIYVIGIKGSGVIPVVEILHSMGIEITGSDTDEKFFSCDILDRLEIPYFEKFDANNVPDDTDLVIYSTAYGENNNVEIRTAREKKLKMKSYPEILAELFNKKFGIAVCGTHGKTTTTALLANVMKEAGTDPQAVVGSKVIEWDSSALAGEGGYFVAEADEYQNKLELYKPKAAILTSCDFDHPDFFEDFDRYKQVFKDFVARIPKTGFLIVWGDSVDTIEISHLAKCRVLSYGFGDDCEYKSKIKNQKSKLHFKMQNFSVEYKGAEVGDFEIQLIGRHNILNATAVIATCHRLGLDMVKVREAFRNFQGTSRRFEYIGERNGAILIDDYGHHPEELKATLKGAREAYDGKTIWAVFHPHTFTRTKALLSEFSQSFDQADKVIVLDIYGSARETQGGVHSRELVDLINKYDFGKAEYIPTIKEVVQYLKEKIGPGDVIIAIGAGNVWEVAEKLKE
jgi:UDP-N-acetylmuramate--alanine ligase